MAEAYYPENSEVRVYTFIEKEISSTPVDGTATEFVVSKDIANTTKIGDYPLPDKSTSGELEAIRDVAVYFRLNGVDTLQEDAAIESIGEVTPKTIKFVTAPTTSEADYVIVSYSHTEINKTFDVTEFSRGGGSREVESTVTYGGNYIDKEKPQEQIEISLTAIANDLAFSEAVNGTTIETTTEVPSITIKTSTGGQTRTPKTIVIDSVDPLETTNHLMWVARNIKGTSLETSAGAEDYYEEKATFKCKPTEFAEIIYFSS